MLDEPREESQRFKTFAEGYWRQLEEGDAVSMHTSQSKCAWNKLVGAP